MAQKSVFSKLQENFKSLYKLLGCADCNRKIDLQSKCSECENFFCTECLFQSKKTKMCKACRATDSMIVTKNQNAFLDELLDLIIMFDNDTGMKIIKDNFLNVESAENLERIFDKEKATVFNQQKFIATSTPNVNNAKKVAFNSDITMIPQKDALQTARQLESVEKTTTKRSSTSNSSNSSVGSKRKATESIAEKADTNNSKAKKAKLVEQAAVEEEVEVAKENEINNEMETDKRSTTTDKQVNDKQVNNSETNKSDRKNAKLQNKEIDDNRENKNSQVSKQTNELEEICKQLEEKNRQYEEETKKLEDEHRQLKQDYRLLEEKIKSMEAKKDFEEKTNQLIDERISEQMKIQFKEYNEQMKQEFNNVLNIERIQDIVLVGLTRIVTNTETPITSSIELDELGKINFTIQPFKEVKKDVRNIEIQTNEKVIGENYVQTELPRLVNQSSNTSMVEKHQQLTETLSQKEIREVVNDVIDECNGNEGNHMKAINLTNGNKSNNNFSVEFDDSVMKDSKESKEDAPLQNGHHSEEIIDSDEIKKPVIDQNLDEDLFNDSDIDEIGASSPIYD